MGRLNERYEKLKQYIAEKGRRGVVIAFSGGVDSSTLAAVSYKVLGAKAVAVTAISPSYPKEELAEAKKVAEEIGIKQYFIAEQALDNPDFVKNPENRCYYCKKELLKSLQDFANKIGFEAIFEGTNFSELGGHRPGFNAVKERENVFSPWAENGFTKAQIRDLAKKLGLSIYNKPSFACLASRIPFNEIITEKKLTRVGRAEKIVKEIAGVKQVRVRDHRGLARIEVAPKERPLLFNLEKMDKIVAELNQLGFKFITLDLEGYRTGSMLKTAKIKRK